MKTSRIIWIAAGAAVLSAILLFTVLKPAMLRSAYRSGKAVIVPAHVDLDDPESDYGYSFSTDDGYHASTYRSMRPDMCWDTVDVIYLSGAPWYSMPAGELGLPLSRPYAASLEQGRVMLTRDGVKTKVKMRLVGKKRRMYYAYSFAHNNCVYHKRSGYLTKDPGNLKLLDSFYASYLPANPNITLLDD